MAEKRYWLVKSEPSAYSFDDLLNEYDQTAEWDGVRNFQARNTMLRDMHIGDEVFFYHSNTKLPAVVGTAIVVREGYPDFTAWDPEDIHYDPKSNPDNPTWFMVDIKAGSKFINPVTLETIKKTSGLADMTLVKASRLSVQPVKREEWDLILGMSIGAGNGQHIPADP